MAETHRKWEVFPGKMRFCCDGRLMCGKDIGVFVFCVVLLTIASGLFFGFTIPYLTVHLSPAIPVFAAVLMALSLAFLIRTGTMDPGVLPRAYGMEAVVNETGRTDTLENGGSRPATEGYSPPARSKTVTIQNQQGTVEAEVTLKYCFTCKIFRPPRSSHCSICDACVDNFDHHCPWVGNCVGRRNYRYFYGFLTALSLYCLYAVAFCILHLVLLSKDEENADFSAVVRKAPLSLVVAIIAFFAMWSVIGMWCYHTMLLSSAKTTNEEIKVSFGTSTVGGGKNPYHLGSMWANLKYALCAPLPQSMLDRRALITDEEFHAHLTEDANLATSAARSLMQHDLPPAFSGESSLTVTRVGSPSSSTAAGKPANPHEVSPLLATAGPAEGSP